VGAADAARARPASAAAIGALGLAEQALGGSLGRLMLVAEAYPELKADETMRSLSEELTSTENRVGFARQAFNDQVLEFNDAATQFPALLVARLLGFAPAAMLQATQSDEERQAPSVQF
jgi:LemA protein